MSRLLHRLHPKNTGEAAVVAETKVVSETDSCSICDYCTCTSSCWMPRCIKHQRELETTASSRRSERMNGVDLWSMGTRLTEAMDYCDAEKGECGPRKRSFKDRFKGMVETVRRKCTGKDLEENEKPYTQLGCRHTSLMRAVDASLASSRVAAFQPNTNSPWWENRWIHKDTNPCAQRKPPHLSFAPLPTDHNASCYDVLLSRQPTPYTDGPCFRARSSKIKKSRKFAARCKDWCKLGRNRDANCVFRRFGNWLHVRKFAVRSRVDERRFWLREKLSRLRVTQACGGEQQRWWSVGPDRVVSDDELWQFWSENTEMGEEIERVCGGDIFGFEIFRRP